jgi:HAD superfamily hydrolase (TIGR01490 family)
MTTAVAMRPAALFDMDHTVLRIDTGMSWMRYEYRRGNSRRRDLARAVYWSLLYKAALLDMESLATRLTAGLAGQDEAAMAAACAEWYARDVAHQVAPSARRAIEHHRNRGELVVLATGSTQYAAEAVARGLGIDHVLCSRIEVAAGRFTGRLVAMGFGDHKVGLAEKFARDHGVDLAGSTFYSDSYNDLPLLRRVGTAVAVNPDARLRRHAARHGWRVERWA